MLTRGVHADCGNDRIGCRHVNAIGYVTIDVVGTCAPTMPNQVAYYERELLFGNVLIGDYEDVHPNS